MRFSVRGRTQNALFRDVEVASPAQNAPFREEPHAKCAFPWRRRHRMHFSVRVRSQNALFRRVRFSSPAQTWSHLTQRRILRRRPHVKAQSAPGDSRKSALCTDDATSTWPKGALCTGDVTEKRTLRRRRGRDVTKGRVLHASGGCVERPFSPICVHSCIPTSARPRNRAGPQVPRRRRLHGPRDARALGPEAHATGAVTQPPTHTNSRSLSNWIVHVACSR